MSTNAKLMLDGAAMNQTATEQAIADKQVSGLAEQASAQQNLDKQNPIKRGAAKRKVDEPDADETKLAEEGSEQAELQEAEMLEEPAQMAQAPASAEAPAADAEFAIKEQGVRAGETATNAGNAGNTGAAGGAAVADSATTGAAATGATSAAGMGLAGLSTNTLLLGAAGLGVVVVVVNSLDDDPAPPTITSNGGGATAAISIQENSIAAVTTVAATGSSKTFSITGGADAAKFEINADTGELKFKASAFAAGAPDFERPTFAGRQAYEVVVAVSSGGLTDTQLINVRVTNVAETSATYFPVQKLDVTDVDFLRTQAGAVVSGDGFLGFTGIGALHTQNPLEVTDSFYLAQTTGIRTSSGVLNNLTVGKENFGAADQPFPRLVPQVTPHRAAEAIPVGFPGAGALTAYNNTGAPNTVIFDSTPREISNLVSNETQFHANTPIPDAFNPLPFSAVMTLFGQFFDHGLDLIPKGGQGTVFMPLLPSDALYNDPRGAGNNFMTLSRAQFTVDADGNRVYTNTVSPLIDQNQTYGSTAGMTVFLREYHDIASAITANGVSITNAYIAAIDAAITDPDNAAIKDALIAIKPTILSAIAGVIASAVSANTTAAISGPVDIAVAAAINGNPNAVVIQDAIKTDKSFFVVEGDPTGRLVTGSDGGMATWADIKSNAAKIGIVLTDADVVNLPKVYLYADGVMGQAGSVIGGLGAGTTNFNAYLGGTYVRANAGANGARVVIRDGFDSNGTFIEPLLMDRFGNVTGPFAAHGFDASAAFPDASKIPLKTAHALLNDIAHGASPVSRTGAPLTADINTTAGGAPPAAGFYDNELLNAHFIAGDGRANENIGLTSIHAVFHSEHNRVVAELRALDAAQGIERTGEQVFQAARLVVEMQYQHIVFAEFARLISPNIALFADYSTQIDPVITLEFSQAVYRFGHSMLTETVDFIDASGNLTEVGLIQAFLNPLAFANLDGTANGLASIMDTGSRAVASQVIAGMSRQVGSEIDELVTPALRNNLLGQPLDLAAINIARGRDVGLPSLNVARAKFFEMTGGAASLKPYVSWTDFGNNLLHPESLKNFIMAYAAATNPNATAFSATELGFYQSSLSHQQWINYRTSTVAAEQDAYALALSTAADNAIEDKTGFMAVGGNQKFNNIDLWLGGLAEKKVFMGMLGSTFDFVFSTQMEALQEGDRLYYLNRLVGTNLLTEIEGQSFADLIMRNSDAKHLYARVFLVADAYVEIGTPGSWRAGGHLYGADGQLLDPDNLGRIGAGWSMATVATVGEDNKATLVDEGAVDNPNTAGVNEAAFNILRFKFTGTDLGEMIGGTDANDDIFGAARNDTIYGDGGHDMIDGGTGDNFLYGGAGNDIIRGGDGVDFIQGNEGDDDIHAGEGIDEAFGGLGNDVIHGGGGSDAISGGGGNDLLFGGDDADDLTGGLGNDTIDGGTGGDIINGQEGNDVIRGGAGEDVMFGMDGDDIFIQSSGDVGLGHLLDGGRGFDIADYSAASSAVQLNLGNNKAAIIQPGPIVTRFDVFDGIEKVIGSNFNDLIIGNDPLVPDMTAGYITNTIVGGKGGDRMSGSLGRDRYEFAQGDSTAVVFGANANNVLDTGDFFDFYTGVGAATTPLADNIIGIINARTANEVNFADFGVGGDTIYLATNLSATGVSLGSMTAPPANGLVTDQQYFMVRGTFNADGGGQFNVHTTAGLDTLVVYDGDSATGANAVSQTALVLSGTGGAAFNTTAFAGGIGVLPHTFSLIV